jgi:hypothetical protein
MGLCRQQKAPTALSALYCHELAVGRNAIMRLNEHNNSACRHAGSSFKQEATMKKVLWHFAAIALAGALSGCYAAPNAPAVTPYATVTPNAPGGAYSNGGVRPG